MRIITINISLSMKTNACFCCKKYPNKNGGLIVYMMGCMSHCHVLCTKSSKSKASKDSLRFDQLYDISGDKRGGIILKDHIVYKK